MIKQVIGLVVGILLIGLFYGYFIEPNTVTVKQYYVNDKELRGLKIAFISDLNLRKSDFKKLNKIISKINKEQPDIVLCGGGYLYNGSVKQSMNIEIIAQKLSLINTGRIYTVLGDEDYKENSERIISALQDNYIRILSNSRARVFIREKNKKFDIVGIDDFTTNKSNISKAFSLSFPPRIVLTHNPDIYYTIMDDANLILAGHHHGGQILLPFLPPLIIDSKYGTKFASGEIKDTQNRMIITKGLGMTKVPLRIGCKPEIVIVNFTY